MNRRSTLYIWCILTAALLLVPCGEAVAKGLSLVKAKPGKSISLEVKGKKRLYYRLDNRKSTLVRVNGPGELQVLTRLAMEVPEGEGVYSVIIKRDEDKRYHLARVTRPSKNAKHPAKNGEVIGESRRFVFKVPEGEHEYRFLLPEWEKRPVYARFLANNAAGGKKVEYIAFLPRKFNEEVRISVKEQEYIYYRANQGNFVELEVIGPTRLKGIARLEFDYTMRGAKRYRIQVTENEKVVSTLPLTAELSGTASYVGITEKVLGKGNVFYLDIPKGKHRYRVSVPDPGVDVLFRFYLPKSDLGNAPSGGEDARAGLLKPIIKAMSG